MNIFGNSLMQIRKKSGLALKNPPKKPTQKNPKNPPNVVFWVFYIFSFL
jgi:hypothetical protein